MTKSINIKNKRIGEGFPTFIIAEMACAHNGDLDQALKLVDVASESGADAIQLQLFSVKDYIVPSHPGYEIVKKLELTADQWEKIIERVKKHNIILFVAAYDRPSVDLAVKNGVDSFKIHSQDLSNPYLTQYIASKGKLITLSTGASTVGEIERGIDFLKKGGCSDIVLMHGYQNFPTRIEEVNLLFMGYLKEKFHLPVGYQDHTDGNDPLSMILPLISLGFGANVIEKHYNLDRGKKGIDYQSALDPHELKDFVANLKQAEKAFGTGKPKPFTADEERYRKDGKKNIVSVRDLAEGQKISFEDIVFVRSAPGIPPTEADKIVGKKAKRAIAKHENVMLEDVA